MGSAKNSLRALFSKHGFVMGLTSLLALYQDAYAITRPFAWTIPEKLFPLPFDF